MANMQISYRYCPRRDTEAGGSGQPCVPSPWFLTPDKYSRLLSLAGSTPQDYAILQVFLQTGIRVSELCSLTLSDVDLTDRTLTIQQGKGMADRTIELEKKGLQALRNKFAGITKKISPHSLRHTFATYKAERGVSPYQLQQWLGHRNLNTTQIYVHLGKQNSRKVMEFTSL